MRDLDVAEHRDRTRRRPAAPLPGSPRRATAARSSISGRRNGSHSHATIRMMDVSGASANQSSGGRPMPRAIAANSPFTGFINRFFQISALTVGITKNGEIISTRAMPRPGNPVSNTAASTAPKPTVMISTAPDQHHGDDQRGDQRRVLEQELVIAPSGEAVDHRVQQIVSLEREPQRHRQRHERPQQQQHHRRCDERQRADRAAACRAMPRASGRTASTVVQ